MALGDNLQNIDKPFLNRKNVRAPINQLFFTNGHGNVLTQRKTSFHIDFSRDLKTSICRELINHSHKTLFWVSDVLALLGNRSRENHQF